jgi:hypothetical protein
MITEAPMFGTMFSANTFIRPSAQPVNISNLRQIQSPCWRTISADSREKSWNLLDPPETGSEIPAHRVLHITGQSPDYPVLDKG